MRHVGQRAMRRGRPHALPGHPDPGDLLDDLPQPPPLNRREVHPHRHLAMRSLELLIDLPLPHVRVTVIQTQCGAAEAIDHPAHERRRALSMKRSADLSPVKLEHRLHTRALQAPQKDAPLPSAGHDDVLAVVPALQPVAQLRLQQPADRQPVTGTASPLGAQRARRSQPPLPVPTPVVVKVVAMPVAHTHAARAAHRPVNRQLTPLHPTVRPPEPPIIRVGLIDRDPELRSDRRLQRLTPVRLGGQEPQRRAAHTRPFIRSSIPAASSSRRRSSAPRWL